MNPKIGKIEAELDKTKKKISSLQEHVRKLEQQKTELENTDIVELVRCSGMTAQELSVIIRASGESIGALMSLQKQQEESDLE